MRLSTSAQFIANRSNAQQSTGPKTPEGKAIAARNNFRHGFTGEFTVLPWEQQEEFDRLLNALRDEHKASDLTERILVDKMAQALWLTKRALMLQHVTFNHELPACDDEKQLALYIRYQTTQERNFHKCLNDLLRLRAEKRKQQIGFESQERKRIEKDHKQADQTRREAGENRKHELHKWNVLLAQAKVDNQELQNMRLETPEHRIHGRVERIIAAEKRGLALPNSRHWHSNCTSSPRPRIWSSLVLRRCPPNSLEPSRELACSRSWFQLFSAPCWPTPKLIRRNCFSLRSG